VGEAVNMVDLDGAKSPVVRHPTDPSERDSLEAGIEIVHDRSGSVSEVR
jgi:hypothetical protein